MTGGPDAREREATPAAPSDHKPQVSLTSAQWLLAFGILAYGAGAAALWVLRFSARADTAATYVGIPTLLAFILATTPRSKTRTGSILKGMTIALMLVGMTLGPGVICLIISLPLFLAVGAIVGRILDAPMSEIDRTARISVVTVALAVASLEGVHPNFTVDPRETVSVTKVLPMSADEFRTRLAKTPQFNRPLPFPLNLGLPVPIRAAGSGLEVGTQRSVFLEDRNIYLTLLGKSGRRDGDVVFAVAENRETKTVTNMPSGMVRFRPVSDQSHVANWVTWTDSTVRWFEFTGRDGQHRLTVTWTVSFDRRLAPAWYFGPLLRYVAEVATGLMLDTVAAQDG